jgi:acyl-[acyl-carrier-protein]-phospholipid O-acyltransferase/long-chain-fatty-acid--[acyl-carrier-protein] ligase
MFAPPMNIWNWKPFLKLMRLVIRVLFRFRAYNEKAAEVEGPVLLIPNHLSWVDWLFTGLCLDTDWKYVASSVPARHSKLHAWILSNPRIFLIDNQSPYAVKEMAAHLKNGGKLVLFAEGRMSRTGTLQRLFEGTGFLLQKTGAKVITCHLRGAQRVLASPHRGWKRWFPKVSAHFSDPVEPPKFEGLKPTEERAKLTQWIRDRLVREQFEVDTEFGEKTLLSAIAGVARQIPNHPVLEDMTHQALTYRRLLVGTDLLAAQWKTELERDTQYVGVLLPNVNSKVVTLLSLWAGGKVPAILNYTAGAATMLTCAQLAGLKQIITSREFLEKAKLEAGPFEDAGIEMIYLEDIREKISGFSKFTTLLNHKLNPWAGQYSPFADTAVILFTSGSEGMPKAVQLTHANLLANVRQCAAVIDLNDTDRFFTCLPLFHSFGLTVGLLLPMVRGMFCFLFPNPLQYRVIPAVFYDSDCTVMLSTNTFLNGYARAAHPADFGNLRYLICGAEKVQQATRDHWAREFGVRINEGYGATETGPVLSANTVIESRAGSVGRLFPGVDYKLEPIEGVAEGGRLLVRGPNIMKGYLNKDANKEFKKHKGWYDTGDIVSVDKDRYITIQGRAKRFAKISGEMVSLTAVEDALAGAFPHHGEDCQVAVISRPDADKGEVLIAATNKKDLEIGEIRKAIQAKGLPNLAAPREIKVLEEIPVLGTGKTNHRELEKELL